MPVRLKLARTSCLKIEAKGLWTHRLLVKHSNIRLVTNAPITQIAAFELEAPLLPNLLPANKLRTILRPSKVVFSVRFREPVFQVDFG